MPAEVTVGALSPRWRTEVKAREPYVVIEQDSSNGESDDTVSIHIDDVDEFIELLKRAKARLKKAPATL